MTEGRQDTFLICEACGETVIEWMLDLEPGLFGEKAKCPECGVFAEFSPPSQD
jgi:hypothetical protein